MQKGGFANKQMNTKLIAKRNLVLRKVLNNQENIDILKDFIEAILDIQIVEIKLNPYLEKKAKNLPAEENFGIGDFRIKTNKEELNVGVQFIDGGYIQTKILIYYAQIHSNQIEYEDNREIAKTITINILDFAYFESFRYHKKIRIPCCNELKFKEEEAEFHIIELPKFNAIYPSKMTKEEQWIAYLKGENKECVETAKNKNEKIKKLDKLLNIYWEKEKME